MVFIDRLDAWPTTKGALGRLKVGFRSNPKEELLRERPSKCPDRFSRSVACNANPESLREMGVMGSGGKFPDVGDREGGGLSLVVELVEGRCWSLAREKALKTSGRGAKFEPLSPNEVELRPANFAREVGCGFAVKIDGLSEEKVSKGNVSIA